MLIFDKCARVKQDKAMSDLQTGNTIIGGIFVEHACPIAAQRQDPILFVHGGCHGSWCWENYLPYFARAGWACYALNWYNHYNSECLPKERFLNRSIADVTQEIGIVARQLGRPPILVGHSMGGLAVLKYAEIAPVKALVLLTPGLPAETGGPGLELALDPAEPFGPPPRDWAKAQFLATSSEAIFDRYYPLLCPESPRAVIEATQATLHVNRTRISHPMLVVAVELDQLAPAKLVRDLAHYYGADYLFVPECGHDLMLEPSWQETAARVKDWFECKCVNGDGSNLLTD